jgi:hypothetical protein
MAEIRTTRLRFISARDPKTLTEALDLLPYKVEIKQIVKDKGLWFAWFIIPEIVSIDFKNRSDI